MGCGKAFTSGAMVEMTRVDFNYLTPINAIWTEDDEEEEKEKWV